jgi:transposase-like protein
MNERIMRRILIDLIDFFSLLFNGESACNHARAFETSTWGPIRHGINARFECKTCGLVYEASDSDDAEFRKLSDNAFRASRKYDEGRRMAEVSRL